MSDEHKQAYATAVRDQAYAHFRDAYSDDLEAFRLLRSQDGEEEAREHMRHRMLTAYSAESMAALLVTSLVYVDRLEHGPRDQSGDIR